MERSAMNKLLAWKNSPHRKPLLLLGPWFDGRCVQTPRTYSPWHSDPRLLAIPTS